MTDDDAADDAADDAIGAAPAPRRLGGLFWCAVVWLAAIGLAAVFAPWLPLRDPDAIATSFEHGLPPYRPSRDHWFGSDTLGRDIFARTIFGARVSLVVGLVAIVCGLAVGGTLGILAGYFRGVTDRVVSFALLVLLSFPALVLAILITTLIDRSLFTISLTLGVLAIAPVGRLARATTLQYAQREFVVAARTLGAGHVRIMLRELLPNVVIPMGALALLGMAVAIVAEGSLAFLGLSIAQGPTWGKVISDGNSELESAPWMALSPVLLLFATVLALNYCGDRLRAHFDVKELSL